MRLIIFVFILEHYFEIRILRLTNSPTCRTIVVAPRPIVGTVDNLEGWDVPLTRSRLVADGGPLPKNDFDM